MGDICLTGTAKVTKMYIYIQLIKVENISIMNREHDASHFPLTQGGSSVWVTASQMSSTLEKQAMASTDIFIP